MRTFTIDVTWVDEQGNAICRGLDERAIEIEADTFEDACRIAEEGHLDAYPEDAERFHPVATEHVY